MSVDINQLMAQLDSQLNSLMGAVGATNQQDFQQQVHQFNLNYANNVAGLYGYNTGVGNPASPYDPTLAAQQAVGGVGFVPGLTGYNTSQSLQATNDLFNQANQSAGQTGFYSAPLPSQYTPGTFVQLDPSSYDQAQYGQQLAYVQPSGQLQHMDLATAQKMGFNGQTSANVPYQAFMQLQNAGPQSAPQQTLQSLLDYSNLNTQAQNQALGQAQVTGMYQTPNKILPPGTAMDGSTFSQLPAATQQAYLARFSGDPQAAMRQWVSDDNATIQAYNQQNGIQTGPGGPQETQQAQQQYFNQAQALAQMFGVGYTPGTPGNPNATSNGQETLAAQQQYANEANQLAQLYGQYYAPLAPGQTAQAGVNAPNPGQITENARQFNVNTASDLAKLASSLSGPADYFKYLTALNGGQNILSNLYTGQAQPAGGAPVGATQPQSLNNIFGQLGINTGANSGGSTTANGQVRLPYGQGVLPQMNQIQPTAYNSMSPSAQQFIQGAYAAAGYNPADLSYNLASETPATGNAPSPGTQTYARTASQSLFA